MNFIRATLEQARASLSRSDYRLVLYARHANLDTHGGNSLASVKAQRAIHRDQGEAQRVVSEVYSRSGGRVASHLDAFECPECGSIRYGEDEARLCCAAIDDEPADEVLEYES